MHDNNFESWLSEQRDLQRAASLHLGFLELSDRFVWLSYGGQVRSPSHKDSCARWPAILFTDWGICGPLIPKYQDRPPTFNSEYQFIVPACLPARLNTRVYTTHRAQLAGDERTGEPLAKRPSPAFATLYRLTKAKTLDIQWGDNQLPDQAPNSAVSMESEPRSLRRLQLLQAKDQYSGGLGSVLGHGCFIGALNDQYMSDTHDGQVITAFAITGLVRSVENISSTTESVLEH